MDGKILQRRTWLNLIGAIILLAGLGGAVLIYQSAGNDSHGLMDFENSRLYRHNLEVYGGKFSVIMDDCRRWFLGLWQGKSLAVLLSIAAIIISLGFFYAAHHRSPGARPASPGQNDDAEPN